jgi:hypothetical protein
MPQPFTDYPNDGVRYLWIVYGQFGQSPSRQGLVEALAAGSESEAKRWEGMMRSRVVPGLHSAILKARDRNVLVVVAGTPGSFARSEFRRIERALGLST